MTDQNVSPNILLSILSQSSSLASRHTLKSPKNEEGGTWAQPSRSYGTERLAGKQDKPSYKQGLVGDRRGEADAYFPFKILLLKVFIMLFIMYNDIS